MADDQGSFPIASLVYSVVRYATKMRVFFILLTVSLLYVVYSVLPFIDNRDMDSLTSKIKEKYDNEYRIFNEEARSLVPRKSERVSKAFKYNEFVDIVAVVAIKYDAVSEVGDIIYSEIKYENIVLVVGLAMIMSLALNVRFSGIPPRTLPVAMSTGFDAFNTESRKINTTATTLFDLFQREMDNSKNQAENLYERSTLLLVGGVIMACLGVGIFYLTYLADIDALISNRSTSIGVSEEQGGGGVMSEVGYRTTVRSVGMLIFLESIAWFLLKQYRALIEDYKWFHRIYIRRSNYFMATTILGKDGVRAEEVLGAIALMNDDISGKLKPGETTESIESIKAVGDNPVNLFLNHFFNEKSRGANVGQGDVGEQEKGKEKGGA